MSTECPNDAEVSQSIEALLSRPAITRAPCDLSVQGRSERLRDGGWVTVLRLQRRDGTLVGERRLNTRAPSCGALRNPIALVVALVLEHDAPELAVEVEVPPAPVATAPETKVQPTSRWASAISVQAALAVGLLPHPAFGQQLGLAAGPADVLMARARLSWWWPTQEEQLGRGGSFWAWNAGIEICPRLHTTMRLELTWCAGAQGGAMMGKGVGLEQETSSSRPFGQVDSGFRLSWSTFGGLRVVGQLGVAIPFARPRFVYRDEAERVYEVHRPAEVIGLAGLGIEMWGPAGLQEASPR